MINLQEEEINYVKQLYSKGYLPGPLECSCKSKIFNIYKDNQYKINSMSFRCANYLCRKKYGITCNSFFNKFSSQKIKTICEIIKCFLCNEFNAKKTFDYIVNNYNVSISKNVIYNVFNEIRNVLIKFINIEYASNLLGEEGEQKYFAVDECNIISIKGIQIWLLGIIDTASKDFRIEPVLNRDAETLKQFITRNVAKGNFIITEGWAGYNFLDSNDSGYTRKRHDHGDSDFGYGRESTSHIESIWAQIRAKLKEIYHSIPHRNFMKFVREIEFKIKIRDKSYSEKIQYFFDAFETNKTVNDSDIDFIDNYFYDSIANYLPDENYNDE